MEVSETNAEDTAKAKQNNEDALPDQFYEVSKFLKQWESKSISYTSKLFFKRLLFKNIYYN